MAVCLIKTIFYLILYIVEIGALAMVMEAGAARDGKCFVNL